MTPDLHARAKAVFLAAQALDPVRRGPYLDEACGGDAELRAEVDSLLAFAGEGTTGPGSLADVVTDHGGLTPGHTYAERYRVVDLLGRGGMGEVYRVHDTVLDQSVALKRVLGGGQGDQARLLHEVRLARQVTHPSVCRVFDVGQVGDELFFTMEYIDGEDMTSLLRRIGRIPPDKVIDIARQACAGLAAAHAKGILHRDLKPGNLMVDRHGLVRITDFGIAVQSTASRAQRLGTPAYMAPELFEGAPASPQTDLYALGLVLYQLLTGRHPFDEAPSGGQPRSARTLVPEIPPALDRAVLAAIDPDPRLRPSSALGFAAALPGVDALRVSLEVGALPSPNLVATAGSPGSLSKATAGALVAAGAIGLAALVLTPGARLVDRVVMADQPPVLAARARALLEQLAGAPPPHATYRLATNDRYLASVSGRPMSAVDGRHLAQLVYRQSAAPVVPALVLGESVPFAVSATNPPVMHEGDASVVVDTSGRLLAFEAVPASAPRPGAVDWTPFFVASGIDPGAVETLPAGDSPARARTRYAWAATRDAGERVRIDAEAAAGHPRRFRVEPEAHEAAPPAPPGAGLVNAVVSIILIPVALLLARRNLRLRVADARGAWRLGGALFVCTAVSGVLGATFMPLALEVQRSVVMIGIQLVLAVLGAAFYLAFEPVVRRRWPWGLIAWSRLLAGRVRDPLVGRDVLLGTVAAIGTSAVYQILVTADIGLVGDRSTSPVFAALVGPRHQLSAFLAALPQALSGAMILVFLFSLFVRLFRHAWAAAGALLTTFLLLGQSQTPVPLVENVLSAVAFALLVALFVRLGLVALIAYLFVTLLTTRLPLSFAADWRSELAVLTLACLAGLLMAAAYVASAPGRVAPDDDPLAG